MKKSVLRLKLICGPPVADELLQELKCTTEEVACRNHTEIQITWEMRK
jgi:hypothetical protein